MKKQIELEKAERVAAKVVATLSPFVEKIEVCGSLRRKKSVVGDLDIICGGVKDEFVGVLLGMGGQFAKVSGSLEIDGVPVDIEVMPLETWGASLLYRTGSAMFNVGCRAIAKRNGYKLSQYGLTDRETGELIAGKTEEEILEKLGIGWVEPVDRSIEDLNEFGRRFGR